MVELERVVSEDDPINGNVISVSSKIPPKQALPIDVREFGNSTEINEE